MSAKGDRESGRGGGRGRSVSVKDKTPKQMSKSELDRQNTLRMAAGARNIFTGHHTEEDKEHRTVTLTDKQLVVSSQMFCFFIL